MRACSSVDRVTASGAVGRAFESPQARHISSLAGYTRRFPPNPFPESYVVTSGGLILWSPFSIVAVGGSFLYVKELLTSTGAALFCACVSLYDRVR